MVVSAQENVSHMYISEFIGTFVLVFTVGCNVLGGVSIWAVTSIAMSLMVGVYALGGVSGAHFNPAVTLAIAVSGKMNGGVQRALIYMLIQVVAGVLAGVLYLGIFKANFNLEPGAGYKTWQAGFAEVIYTFMLCFVVLNTACATKNAGNQYFGLAIGSVIIAGGYAVGTVSGGAFNPAVAIGVDLSSFNKGFGFSLVYVAFEFIGALLAAGAFRLVQPNDFYAQGQSPFSPMQSKLAAEFIGTYMLVVTVGFNVLTGSAAAAYSIAASLMCMIYAVGSVSGGHLNPAVTLAILFSGRNKISATDALYYMVAQILGGIAASMTYVSVMQRSFHLGPVGAHSWSDAGIAEVIFTFVLCFVVLSVATVQNPSKDFFGLAIGACVTVGGFAIGGVSGGSLNPAVSIGIDVGDAVKGGKFGNSLIYSVFEVVGAALAAGAFYATRPVEYNKATPLPVKQG